LNPSGPAGAQAIVPLKLKRFLEDLVEILEQDFPEQTKEIIEGAQGINCLQFLDKEKAVIQVLPDKISIVSTIRADEINIKVTLSRKCLSRLLDGESTMEEAFNAKEMEVFGEPATLLRCYRVWEKVLALSRVSPRFEFLLSDLW
jgi:hypothetical protein